MDIWLGAYIGLGQLPGCGRIGTMDAQPATFQCSRPTHCRPPASTLWRFRRARSNALNRAYGETSPGETGDLASIANQYRVDRNRHG